MYTKTILGVIATGLAATTYAVDGTGQTTRYWDCCKPSCAWSGKAAVSSPVRTCDKNDSPLGNVDTKSGCDGGSAYTCSNFSPWAVNDNLAYGFAATKLSGGTESSWCCGCYEYVQPLIPVFTHSLFSLIIFPHYSQVLFCFHDAMWLTNANPSDIGSHSHLALYRARR